MIKTMMFSGVMALVFLFTGLNVMSQCWDSTMYAKYDFKTIANYSYSKERINPQNVDISFLNALVFYETNRQRVLNKLPQFQYSTLLEQCAQGHSDDMKKYSFFSHTSVVNGRETMVERLQQVGLSNITCAENIINNYMMPFDNNPYYPPSQTGNDFRTIDGKPIEMYTYIGMAKALVDAWMNSPGHRANILNEDLKYLGVGTSVYFEGEGIDKVPYVYGTQNFGTF